MSIEFLERIYSDSTGMLDVVVKEGNDWKIERWFNWPEDQSEIERYMGRRANDDVAVPVALYSTEKRTKNDEFAVAHAVGIDADACHPDKLRLEPSIKVETSPDRWHVWYLLDGEVTAEEAALAAQRIAKAHQADGADAPGTHSVSKILRVPGTANTKYVEGEVAWEVEVTYTDLVYTLDELHAAYEDIALGVQAAKQEATITANDFDEDWFNGEQMARLRAYAVSAWEEDLLRLEAGMVDGSWHVTGYRVACNMYRNANVVWSEYTEADVIEAVTEAAQADSIASELELQRILRDAKKEVAGSSLALPAWALEHVPDLPPTPITGAALKSLESRLKAASLTDLYVRALGENETATHRTHALAKALFTLEMTPVEVFSLTVRAPANMYGNARTPNAIWADVQWAYDSLDREEDTVDQDEVASFLSDTERAYLRENPCFVDRYLDWVKGRTDAAPVYSESLSWIVLSTIYSDKGFIPLSHGPEKLNLWLLVLGDTTSTRKSTAKNHALRLIREYEHQTGLKYDIGSNATAEGIVKELGERGGATSLLHTDEVNGFFRSVYSKTHMSGVLETYTELYDGTVPVSIRAGKDAGNKNRVPTQFIFLGVGIRKDTAEILTKKNFESGFLARMLWSVADAPANADLDYTLSYLEGESTRDETMHDLVDELTSSASYWDSGERVSVRMNEAARERAEAWATTLIKMTHRMGDTLKASTQRLIISVQKAASLLALHEAKTEVELRHLLFALRQAESWYRDMVRMSNEVSASEFERRLSDVEEFILEAKDGIRTKTSINRKFASLRPAEVEEILTALRNQGRLRPVPNEAGKVETLR